MMTKREDIAKLLELLAWARDKLEKLGGHTRDEFLLRNLRAVARSLDPATNPRLGAVVERHRAREEAPALTEHQERKVTVYGKYLRRTKKRGD